MGNVGGVGASMR
ncbi:hypothetical protein CISIN_1g0199362mg, partial [Citrus sinensis]